MNPTHSHSRRFPRRKPVMARIRVVELIEGAVMETHYPATRGREAGWVGLRRAAA